MRKKKPNRSTAALMNGRPSVVASTLAVANLNVCVGCKAADTTLVTLPRDTNPKEIFPDYVRDKSRACISCTFHAIQIRQVRDAMSYKLDVYQHQKQMCLVCNATTGLTPINDVKGAKEAVSHPIINAQNIDKYLKSPCSLCTSCAYPLQWLYNKILDPKPPEKTSPRSLKKTAPAKPSKSVAIAVDTLSSDYEESESEKSEEEEKVQVNSSKRKPTPANLKKPAKSSKPKSEESEEEEDEEEVQVRSSKRKTPPRAPAKLIKPKSKELEKKEEVQVRFSKRKPPANTPAKLSTPKTSVVAKKIAQRVQTPARPSSTRIEAKKTPVSASNSTKAVTGKEFWSNRQLDLTPTRTRTKTASTSKRESESDHSEQEKQVPSKKTKVASKTPLPKKPIPAAKTPVKKTAAPASKKKLRQPSISPPPPRSNMRRKQELEERVCETCQQVFYSGTELALHELRHTGKVLRIMLDKYEIPEPVQTLERSYLFQNPVNLEGPSSADSSRGPHEFSFEAPKILDETVNGILAEQEALPDPPDIFQSANDNSNSATENAVDSIIESLRDDAEVEDKNEHKEKEKSPPLTVATALSLDFFPPSSPKESSKPTTSASLSFDFFEAPDPPGMKTPPPSTTATTSLSFDFFGSADSSPSKDCSMFSPPSVDPSLALKANSDNPVLPFPSDSDNSMTLTPPKEGIKFDKLEAAVREAVGDA